MARPGAPADRFYRTHLVALLLAGAGALAACNGAPPPQSALTDVATLPLALPAALGPLDRPAVPFRHQAHAEALKSDCAACHQKDAQGRLLPLFARSADAALDREALTELYHGRCIGCHEQKSGAGKKLPLTCGECHTGASRSPAWRPIGMDASLHARHVKAEPECGRCHHEYDEQADKLVYRKGAEEACRTCHGETDKDDVRSLAAAAHLGCVSCHLADQQAGKKSGPISCAGCHSAAGHAAISRLAEVPRLERGQPELSWIKAQGGSAPAVLFDHRDHEQVTDRCGTCHHQSLKPCDECHTLSGSESGNWITLEQAYHHPSSRHSCVGCHEQQTKQAACAACHHALPAGPGARSCTVCHSGPAGEKVAASQPTSKPERPELAPLPPTGPDFPAQLSIDVLGAEYQPAQLPHQQIVAALQAKLADSELAQAFHGDTAVLCAGCHHHSPLGQRPPACRACHSQAGQPGAGRPSLFTAYHQQCLGCHQQLGHQAQGCTDCHAKAAKEASR